MQRKLRMGMVGGGPGSFIGAVHRIAANMDGKVELVCGAFSSSLDKSKETAKQLFLSEDRVYANYEELISKEAALPEDERMDFLSIVTPNFLHFAPAKLALENGFHVVLDKPMTITLEEAKELDSLAKQNNLVFCLTHTYTGYPMVKEARDLVSKGVLGNIYKVYVEYPQGWLSTFGADNEELESPSSWHTDPAKSGLAGSMGDIGTHAFNMAEYVSGLEVTAVCAALNKVVPGRRLDDDGAVLLQFGNGATGVLMASQVATGEENNIKVRVYGEKGGLEWQQDIANTLLLKWRDKPAQIYRTGGAYVGSFAKHNTRVPAGHPEGYLEAFANHYRNFASTVLASINGETPSAEELDFPGTKAGVRGMAFVESVVSSGDSEQKWTPFAV
ncbi:Gfo/Idh/MocA family protein [Olivibacter sitiensis]|uniref:Gfo/Idh/MocA family protein n=1 Tax=Olivibacter sitiensis TaxID=376470 RepID=UPI0003FE19FD|nr:Gfo/Idh/MocA family oxidoreductase [Olivibacter sitiensis]